MTMRRFAASLIRVALRALFALGVVAAAVPVAAQVAVTTNRNDLNRTGANTNETILNTSNVNVDSFGKLFSRTVDGQIYAQPLYVPNVTIPGQGVRNVVYVATEHNSVYAFDADDATRWAPFWEVNLGPSAISPTNYDLVPEVGISGTPVIDQASGTMYVVAETYEIGQVVFRLHALDIATGGAKSGSPRIIQGSVPGTSVDSVGGVLAFRASMHFQRAGLLLLNGAVYVAFGSHQDTQPFHGWLFAYDATTLLQTAIKCFSPDTHSVGLWQGGSRPHRRCRRLHLRADRQRSVHG